jgi:hypothetical protein
VEQIVRVKTLSKLFNTVLGALIKTECVDNVTKVLVCSAQPTARKIYRKVFRDKLANNIYLKY